MWRTFTTTTSSALRKLQVYGLLVHSVGTFIVALGVALSFKFGVSEPREKACADFFRK